MIQNTAGTVTAPAPAATNGRGGVRQPLEEQFGGLVARLATGRGNAPWCGTVGVTSCTRGEGVTTVAVNLATSAARGGGCRVLLVDVDGDRGGLARAFSVDPAPGLAEAIARSAEPADCRRATALQNLFVMPAGNRGKSAAAASARQAASLLERWRTEFDLVILDLPPIDAPGGCLAWAGEVNGMVLVIEAERVRGHVARRAKDSLEQAGAKFLGAVLNKRRLHVPGWIYRNV
jgi:protein-tyrosine kinase